MGVPVCFVMAMRRDGEHALGGHAWIERDGVPYGGENVDGYVVTFSFPS
jgi:hypothetical protein